MTMPPNLWDRSLQAPAPENKKPAGPPSRAPAGVATFAVHISAYRALSMAANRAAFSLRRRRSLGFS